METKQISPELISTAENLWVNGVDPVKIRAELRRNDMDERTIDKIINEIKFKHGKSKAVKLEGRQANKDLIWGGIICLIGIIITVISISSGGRGIIAYGAVFYGGFRFVKGFIGMANND